MKFNFDWRWSLRCTVFLLMILIIPCAQFLNPDPNIEKIIEQGQTIFLFFCFLLTLILTFTFRLKGEIRAFWLWAALWWLVLLGRDQNWGRQMWPGFSIALYHTIAAV